MAQAFAIYIAYYPDCNKFFYTISGSITRGNDQHY